MPPIAADSAATCVLTIFIVYQLIDVEMALEDGEDIVRFEEGDDVGGIRDGHGIVARSAVWFGTVGEIAGDQRDVSDDDDGRGGSDGGEIVREPLELRVVNAAFPETIGRGENGIEDDEVVAAMIEGVVSARADAVFEHFFAVAGIAGRGAAFGEDAVEIVIADGVMERRFDGGFGALVEIVEHVGASAADGESVIYEIAAADGEFGIGRGDFCESHLAAVGGVQFGLDVRVGEEDEVEGFGGGLRFCGGGVLARP